ncbi:MAG: hypothetical protein WBE76_16320 [Terracidiphilus sp.]
MFGPAASRDPETALVRIRCAKFTSEFTNANWASMTLYMRSPLDLSALPLNGPRVPQAGWSADPATNAPAIAVVQAVADIVTQAETGLSDTGPADADATDEGGIDASMAESVAPDAAATDASKDATAAAPIDLWSSLAATVGQLQPGTLNEFHGFDEPSAPAIATLPVAAFRPWRGNVIRLDGSENPLSQDTIAELNVAGDGCPPGDVAEKLVWFFDRIAHYGSPLVVWTNASPRHWGFLKAIEPSSTLTFLLIYGPQPAQTILELVDANRLEEAQAAAQALPPGCGDEQLSAAYFAFAGLEDPAQAVTFMRASPTKAS